MKIAKQANDNLPMHSQHQVDGDEVICDYVNWLVKGHRDLLIYMTELDEYGLSTSEH